MNWLRILLCLRSSEHESKFSWRAKICAKNVPAAFFVYCVCVCASSAGNYYVYGYDPAPWRCMWDGARDVVNSLREWQIHASSQCNRIPEPERNDSGEKKEEHSFYVECGDGTSTRVLMQLS